MDQLIDLSVDEVRGALRGYFADHPGTDEIRAREDAAGSGFDPAGWRLLAEQLGLLGIVTPERWGGLGAGAGYAVAAVEECGAALSPAPVRASVLLAMTLAGVAPDDVPDGVRDRVEGFLAGEVIAGSSIRVDAPLRAVFAGSTAGLGGTVDGRVEAVTHGEASGLLICAVETADGPAIALAAPRTDAVRERIPGADLAVPLADVVVAAAPAVLLTAPGDQAAMGRFRTLEALLLAAEQVGGAQGCLGQMVDYAKVREQFGVLIGTYQAIQHRCAGTAIETAAARALVAAAAQAFDAGDETAAEQFTLLARADAAEAFTEASASLIQVSGGIGFTWEHPAHLYFRRARALAAIGGPPARLRDRAVAAGCLDLLLAAA